MAMDHVFDREDAGLSQAETGGWTSRPAQEGASPLDPAAAHPDEPVLRGIARGHRATLRGYTAVLQRRDALIVALERFLGDWDAWLCPVAAGPAFPHAPTGAPLDVGGRAVPYWLATTGHACPFNFTGSLVVVLPVARSRQGLPLGVQLVGRRWGEMALLAVAARLAEVAGPCQHPPGY